MLLATVNSGTLIIALPDLERSLGTTLLQLVWVILAYMIASTVLVLTAGRLSDLFGRKKAYVAGFVVFALASLGAGFSGSGTELILWRIVQGIGGAFLFANSGALVTDAFPKEQLGVAMGTNTMVAAVGLVLGPVLGGALVELSWHWVFWFNVPLRPRRGALGRAGAPRAGQARHRPRARPARHHHLHRRADRARARHLARRAVGLGRPDRPRRPGGRRRPPPHLRADRAPQPRADARPVDLRGPAVRGRHRGGVHQRTVALRADVRVRLLLPGRAGRRPDPGRHQARPDGARDARVLAAGRAGGGPARLARAGRLGHGRERGGTRR